MSKIKGNMHDQEPRTAAGKSNRSKRPHVLDEYVMLAREIILMMNCELKLFKESLTP